MNSQAQLRGRHPSRPWMKYWNAFTIWILHVPLLRRMADRQVCELRFTAARSGKAVALPVMYAEHGNQIVVLVGWPRSKRWWRNFRQPHPVLVWLHGSQRTGTGHVAGPRTAAWTEAASIYGAKFPDLPVQGDPLVVITIDL